MLEGAPVATYHPKHKVTDKDVHSVSYGPKKRWDGRLARQSQSRKEVSYQHKANNMCQRVSRGLCNYREHQYKIFKRFENSATSPSISRRRQSKTGKNIDVHGGVIESDSNKEQLASLEKTESSKTKEDPLANKSLSKSEIRTYMGI